LKSTARSPTELSVYIEISSDAGKTVEGRFFDTKEEAITWAVHRALDASSRVVPSVQVSRRS
jgi:hypothetical protein